MTTWKSTAGPPAQDEVIDRLRRALPHLGYALQPGRSLHEFPLDSLDLVELLCTIESEFAVTIREADFAVAVTVGDLANLIAGSSEEINFKGPLP